MDNAGEEIGEVRQIDIDDNNALKRGTTESMYRWISFARVLDMHVARRGD